jgi:hypothetical protein
MRHASKTVLLIDHSIQTPMLKNGNANSVPNIRPFMAEYGSNWQARTL